MAKLLATGIAVATVALLAAASAAAATAPTAATGPVTSVGPTSATVSGSVNPNGAATSWYVEFGTTAGYGSKTAAVNAGSGTATTTISETLTGLTPGTSYHYRVVATNSAGTGRGADGLLTTSAAPQASTGGASSVTVTSATLNGTVNPSGRATTSFFEYGTSTSYGSKTPVKDVGSGTTSVAVSGNVTGLTPARSYHFRLVATSDAGTSHGSDQTFTTAAAPAVTTKGASTLRDSTATLNGTVNPNGQSTTAYFEYGTSTSYGTKTAGKSIGSAGSTSSVAIGVSGLSAGTTYHFRIVASNVTGTSTGRDQTFATTGPPAVRTGGTTTTSPTGSTLTGSVDSRGHSTSWYFEYGTKTSYGLRTSTRTQSSTSGARSVSEAITGLTAGTSYHFRLVAKNSAGTSYGADAVFTTTGPAVTLVASAPLVIHHGAVALSGIVSSGRENESVTVYAQRFGVEAFAAVATVLTRAGGAWTLIVRPTIATTYKSVWNGNTTPPINVAVRPAVSIRALTGLRFATHITAERRFVGRTVQLQRRLTDGRWLTLARANLNRRSSAVFHPALRRGRWTLRVAISVNQAGGGYLAGFSRAITVRKR
jgi:phosphodiesterase/alkaline phosphatase D-like protein